MQTAAGKNLLLEATSSPNLKTPILTALV